MYGILGENDSDVEMLRVLIRRLLQPTKTPVKGKGYDSCGELLRKGAHQLKAYAKIGCTRFVVCYDSDGEDPAARRRTVMERVVAPTGVRPFESGMVMAGIGLCCCILIPVQEIEAWILADIAAVSKVFTSWRPSPIREDPETIRNPKEYLESLSRQVNKKPIYHHATHNRAVAEYLNLGTVRRRCASFGPLMDFVLN